MVRIQKSRLAPLVSSMNFTGSVSRAGLGISPTPKGREILLS